MAVAPASIMLLSRATLPPSLQSRQGAPIDGSHAADGSAHSQHDEMDGMEFPDGMTLQSCLY